MTHAAVATLDAPAAGPAMTGRQRAAFERDGFLLLPGILDRDEVGHYASIVDSPGTRTAAGRTASWRPTRAPGCR
jgi:hypothetical protein